MLRMRLFGGLHLTLDDEPLSGFISAKAQALLCYIALNPHQSHLRSTLAAMFWGDMPDEDAATNLRQVIANLKKLLEPYLEINRQSVAFKAEIAHWIDVEAFQATLNPELYQGELLAGFGLPDALPFDHWLTAERERLHELALTTLRKQISAQRANNQFDAVILGLQRLIMLDPLDENAYQQLMLLYALNGQRSAALAQYDACRQILVRELDIEPEEATTRLYQRIKNAQKRVSLPSESTTFIGRENELKELTRRLLEPSCHLITIAGLGGIGKTRLAIRLAYLQVNQMLHGVIMVNLTSVHSQESFLNVLADGLGFSMSREGDARQQILNYLREKHLLLVLDNFEQLIGTVSDFLGEVIRTAAEVKVVVTSRERLNLRGEWVLALEGLPSQSNSGKSPPAQELFWETARRVRGDERMTNQSPQVVQHICDMVSGMPLAIELAAAWTRLLTCEELAEEIASNLTALESTTRDTETRHQSLRAVFEQSWQLFSDHEQRVLMALSSFVAGFTRDAAEKVAGASLAMLLGLADKMLVRRDGPKRFSLHEMMRQYLAEKLAQSDHFVAVQKSLCQYYAHFLEQRSTLLTSAKQQTVLNEVWQDIDNIHTAWDIAIFNRDSDVLRNMVNTMSLVHDLKATWIIGEVRLRQLVNAGEWEPKTFYADSLSQLAFFNSRLERGDETERLVTQSLQLLDLENPEHFATISRCWMAQGFVRDTQGKFDSAIELYHRALELRTRSGDEWGQANCYLNLASANGRAKKYEETRRLAQLGLRISHRLDDLLLTTKFQTNLAICASELGELEQSVKLHTSNLEIFKQLDSLEGQALALNGLAIAAYYQQQFQEAQDLFITVLQLNRQLGAQTWEGGTLNNIAEAAREMGDLPTALRYFRESQQVFRAIGHEQHVQTLQKDVDAIEERLASASNI